MAVVMKQLPHMNRAEVIFKWTALMQQETRCTDETFGIRVVDWYHANVPGKARTLTFQTDGDPFRCAKSNAQRLFRFPKQDVNARFPVELEEAWVLGGLVEPYRSECVRELARRYGMLAVPLPSSTSKADVQSIGQFTQEMGRVLEVMGPVIADARIDESDAATLPPAIAEIEKMMAAAEAIRAKLINALPGTAMP